MLVCLLCTTAAACASVSGSEVASVLVTVRQVAGPVRRCEQPGLPGARRPAAHHGATWGGGGRAHLGRDHTVVVGGD